MRKDPLKGQLELMLLAIFQQGPAHGYAVIQELLQRSDGAFDMAEGTVYPALHRLEAADLITSWWVEEAGRRRRLYKLTARGRKILDQQRQEWRDFSRAVDAVLRGA